MSRQAIAAWIVCFLAFVYVVFDFSSIWPFAAVDVGKPRQFYVQQAHDFFDREGIDYEGYQPFVSLAVRDQVLDVLQDATSIEDAAELAKQPNGLVRFYVRFKKKGTPRTLMAVLHPDGQFVGYLQEENPFIDKGGFSESEFRDIAKEQLLKHYQLSIADVKESKFDSELIDGVQYYRIDLERPFQGNADLREIFAIGVAGKELNIIGRRIELTKKAELVMNRAEGPEQTLGQFGFLVMVLCLIVVYILFLFQLRGGKIELALPLKVSLVMFGMVLISGLLDANVRYRLWDPVWPTASMWIEVIFHHLLVGAWAFVLGWVLLAGGTQAPAGGRESMNSFWDYVRFRWTRSDIALASIRGGALGFACGAAAILLVHFFEWAIGGEVGLQPRAFYLSMLDRQLPALAIVLFFFPIAVVEEAGYRLFASSWIRHLTGQKWLAILIPAIIFGIIHTSLGFLPPEDPWWGRAVVMTMIGIIWGWAYFKFGFLTVVLCHFMADVVIFSWPLLVSAYLPSKIMAAVGISTALWPAIFWLIWRFCFNKRKS